MNMELILMVDMSRNELRLIQSLVERKLEDVNKIIEQCIYDEDIGKPKEFWTYSQEEITTANQEKWNCISILENISKNL